MLLLGNYKTKMEKRLYSHNFLWNYLDVSNSGRYFEPKIKLFFN
jgi:hypothetical protein